MFTDTKNIIFSINYCKIVFFTNLISMFVKHFNQAIMKTLILFAAIIPLLCIGQKKDKYWLKQGIAAGACFVAGWYHGTNEVSVHDYRRFAARHPRANPQWHNPKLSYVNKYRDWPLDKRAKFPGSTTVLVGFTDGYHHRSTKKNLLLAGNAGITMCLYTKPKFKDILIQAAASWAIYALGTGAAHSFYKPVD